MSRDETVAEDLISEVFLDVWRQADQVRRTKRRFDLALAIARFKALSACGASGAKKELDDEAAGAIEDTSDNPESCGAEDGQGRDVATVPAALSREHREVIDLVYYHEKSVEEVAEIIGIPENTVKTRMFYARKKLGELC